MEQYHYLMNDELDDVAQHRLHALKKIQENKVLMAWHFDKKLVPRQFEEVELVWKLILPVGAKDNRFVNGKEFS